MIFDSYNRLNLVTSLVSNWKGRNWIILKNWSTKLNKKFKYRTKLKTTITTVMCHDCKLPRDTIVKEPMCSMPSRVAWCLKEPMCSMASWVAWCLKEPMCSMPSWVAWCLKEPVCSMSSQVAWYLKELMCSMPTRVVWCLKEPMCSMSSRIAWCLKSLCVLCQVKLLDV